MLQKCLGSNKNKFIAIYVPHEKFQFGSYVEAVLRHGQFK